MLAYTAYLGHAQIAHATPDLMPAGEALGAYVEDVVRTLLGDPHSPQPAAAEKENRPGESGDSSS